LGAPAPSYDPANPYVSAPEVPNWDSAQAAQWAWAQQQQAPKKPKGPSPFAPLVTILGAFWHGKPVEAIDQAGAIRQVGGTPALLLYLTPVVNALFIAILTTQLWVKATTALLSDLARVFGVGSAMPVGPFFALLALNLVLAAGYLAARMGVSHVILRMRGSSTTFSDVMVTQSAIQVFWVLPLAAFALISFIPGSFGAWLYILIGTFLALAYFVHTEIANYLGINRLYNFPKSPLLPCTVVVGLLLSIIILLTALLNSQVLSSLL
jgi:hypothetical protein